MLQYEALFPCDCHSGPQTCMSNISFERFRKGSLNWNGKVTATSEERDMDDEKKARNRHTEKKLEIEISLLTDDERQFFARN